MWTWAWNGLTLSTLRSLSYRNQFIASQSKSKDWFLYDRDLHHGRVKDELRLYAFYHGQNCIICIFITCNLSLCYVNLHCHFLTKKASFFMNEKICGRCIVMFTVCREIFVPWTFCTTGVFFIIKNQRRFRDSRKHLRRRDMQQ